MQLSPLSTLFKTIVLQETDNSVCFFLFKIAERAGSGIIAEHPRKLNRPNMKWRPPHFELPHSLSPTPIQSEGKHWGVKSYSMNK